MTNIWVHYGNHGFYTDFGTKNKIEIGEFYHTYKQNYIERGNTGVKSVYDFTEGEKKGEYRKETIIEGITILQESKFDPCLIERNYYWEKEKISQDKYYDLIIQQFEVWKKYCWEFAQSKIEQIKDLHKKGMTIDNMSWSTLGSNHVSYSLNTSRVELKYSDIEALYKGDVKIIASMV